MHQIIIKIFNVLLENKSPEICSALCFGLTSRRNWAILRDLDHRLNDHKDQIPSIIDFKYDQIPFTEYDGPMNLFNPHFYHDWRAVDYSITEDQRDQLLLFEEWMGPKYRPPTFETIPFYLSYAEDGETSEETSGAEKTLEKRYKDFVNSRSHRREYMLSSSGLCEAWHEDVLKVSSQKRKVNWSRELLLWMSHCRVSKGMRNFRKYGMNARSLG
ncbi:hypothetical protein EAF04_007092 [Stromatinia cepivora]|nr:hypothetical protein EAF04_007092 [Stromatinia cepivora]